MQIAQTDFWFDCKKTTQGYLMYFKEFSCNQAENMQARCVPRFVQRFLSYPSPKRKTRCLLFLAETAFVFGIGLCLGSSYGAGICTSAAVDALIGVDLIDIACFDCFNRTSVSTCTTSDASVGNCISHWYVSSFLNCRQCCRYRNYSRQCAKNQVFLNIFKNFFCRAEKDAKRGSQS